jgi:hypothetical protein
MHPRAGIPLHKGQVLATNYVAEYTLLSDGFSFYLHEEFTGKYESRGGEEPGESAVLWVGR